jgi:hypothetical protein
LTTGSHRCIPACNRRDGKRNVALVVLGAWKAKQAQSSHEPKRNEEPEAFRALVSVDHEQRLSNEYFELRLGDHGQSGYG